MASVEGRTYPFNSAEVKVDKDDHCTLTFHLKGLRSKHKAEASITGRTLTVRVEVDGKVHQIRPELGGDVEQGKLEPKVKDNKMHVTFKKKSNFSMSALFP